MNKLNLGNTLKPRYAIALALTLLATSFLAATSGKGEPAQVTANANKAVTDESVVALLGAARQHET